MKLPTLQLHCSCESPLRAMYMIHSIYCTCKNSTKSGHKSFKTIFQVCNYLFTDSVVLAIDSSDTFVESAYEPDMDCVCYTQLSYDMYTESPWLLHASSYVYCNLYAAYCHLRMCYWVSLVAVPRKVPGTKGTQNRVRKYSVAAPLI